MGVSYTILDIIRLPALNQQDTTESDRVNRDAANGKSII